MSITERSPKTTTLSGSQVVAGLTRWAMPGIGVAAAVLGASLPLPLRLLLAFPTLAYVADFAVHASKSRGRQLWPFRATFTTYYLGREPHVYAALLGLGVPAVRFVIVYVGAIVVSQGLLQATIRPSTTARSRALVSYALELAAIYFAFAQGGLATQIVVVATLMLVDVSGRMASAPRRRGRLAQAPRSVPQHRSVVSAAEAYPRFAELASAATRELRTSLDAETVIWPDVRDALDSVDSLVDWMMQCIATDVSDLRELAEVPAVTTEFRQELLATAANVETISTTVRSAYAAATQTVATVINAQNPDATRNAVTGLLSALDQTEPVLKDLAEDLASPIWWAAA